MICGNAALPPRYFASMRTLSTAVKRTALALALAAPLLAHAEPSPTVLQEVKHLLGFIEQSGCDFNRNGSWADAKSAQSHVMTKFEYLLRQDKIASALDFIEKAASESSMTGTPYQVKCGKAAPILSRAWLTEELKKYQSRYQSKR
jgi:hypothetical protein